jgi:hypothetical protein
MAGMHAQGYPVTPEPRKAKTPDYSGVSLECYMEVDDLP